jgi:hypothetical protein
VATSANLASNFNPSLTSRGLFLTPDAELPNADLSKVADKMGAKDMADHIPEEALWGDSGRPLLESMSENFNADLDKERTVRAQVFLISFSEGSLGGGNFAFCGNRRRDDNSDSICFALDPHTTADDVERRPFPKYEISCGFKTLKPLTLKKAEQLNP